MSLIWTKNGVVLVADTVEQTVREVVKRGVGFHLREVLFWLEIDGAIIYEDRDAERPRYRTPGYAHYVQNSMKVLEVAQVRRALRKVCSHRGGDWYTR